MISWEEYIKSNIIHFRKSFHKLPSDVKEAINKDITAFNASLNKPCQVIVVNFKDLLPKCFVVTHSQFRPDIETIVFEDVEFEEFSSNLLIDESRVLAILSSQEIKQLTGLIKKLMESTKEKSVSSRGFKNHSCLHLFKGDLRNYPRAFSNRMRALIDFKLRGSFEEVFMSREREVPTNVFPDEKALRDYVVEKLKKEGYKIIGTEVAVYGRKRVDILTKNRKNRTVAFEVKRSGRTQIADDITKLNRLAFIPEIDLFYVAVPKMNLQDDLLQFARKLRVGVVGITELGLEWLIDSEARQSSKLHLSSSFPNLIKPEQMFEFKIDVKAVGEKMVRDIQVMYMPASPFRVPKGEINRKNIKELMCGQEALVSFRVRVEDNAEEGKHPLYIYITRSGAKPRDQLHYVIIKKEIQGLV